MTTPASVPSLFRTYSHALALLLLCLLAGCAANPVGVTRFPSGESYRQSAATPLNGGVPSNATRVVLQRYDLTRASTDDPVATIRTLHKTALVDERRDILFALAELSFLYGEQLHAGNSRDSAALAPDYFLLSAVYAYLYLLGDGTEPPPTAWDVRFREACNLYNSALGRGFPVDESGSLLFGERVHHLPTGDLTVIPDMANFTWKIDDFKSLLPADTFAVFGLTVRNRNSGMGLPLIAVLKQSPETPPGVTLPVTVFLRITCGLTELGSGKATASLEFYSAFDDTSVQVNDRTVPLETDSTAPLAYRLNDSALWRVGLRRFLGGDTITRNLILIQPFEPERIPVVFIHGTASSPVWWAEMLNTLRADPVIRTRFQFWFFQYNSSRMTMLSAADLRDTLTNMVHQHDPQGTSRALRQMVVIGHSQGGLLAKMTVVAPGNRLWKALSDQGLDDMNANKEFKEMARRMFFFEPLPFVTRVVFIATPHRGSFRTTEWVRNLVRRIITMPVDIFTSNPDIYSELSYQLTLPSFMRNRVPTSIDSMTSDNPTLQALAALPLAPGVKGHSIIAVLPGMEIETGNDGVVEFQSARIEGMESEFIVRFGHSAQGHPFTIEEVRRILREHISGQVSPQ